MQTNRQIKSLSKPAVFTFLFLFLLVPFGWAQEAASPEAVFEEPSLSDEIRSTPITVEGVVGDADRNRRAPILTVSTVRTDSVVKILADAYVFNTEMAKYPIQFDFFINRRLYSSQIRSVELPGPVGVEIGPEVAQVPFNYVVIAKVIHPNKTYTTALQAAVERNEFEYQFASCTLTQIDVEGESTISTAQNVTATQVSANQFGIAFAPSGTGENIPSAVSIVVEVDRTTDPANRTVSATMDLTVADQVEEVELDGTLKNSSQQDSALQPELSLESSAGEVTVLCR